MDNWPILGIILILVGVVILAVLSGFIVTIVVELLKLVAVFAGIVLIAIGIGMILGRRWWWRRARWGPPAAST